MPFTHVTESNRHQTTSHNQDCPEVKEVYLKPDNSETMLANGSHTGCWVGPEDCGTQFMSRRYYRCQGQKTGLCISGVIMWQQRSEPSLRSISFYICMCMYIYTQTYIHIIGFLSFTSKLSILYYRCHSRTRFNKYFTVNLRPHVYVTIFFTTNQNVSCLFFTDMVTREALY